MTRLLVAGIGLIGRRHADHIAAHPNMTLAGVIDPEVTVPDVPNFRSIEDVDIAADGIVIATPSHLHADHARAAAKRGWPMIVEKPLASDLAQADQIIHAAEAANIPVLVGHHRRHHARVQKLKELIDDNAIGQPVVASMIWAMKKPDSYFDVSWRKGRDGAPVLMNLIHEVDLLRHLFGEVVDVSGAGASHIRSAGRVESGGAILHFESGFVASITFADTTPSPWGFEAGTGENPNIATTSADYLNIAGSAGAISFPSLTHWRGAVDWSQAAKPRAVSVSENVPLITQLEHFSDVIAKRLAPICSARDARASLEITLRVEAAVDPERRVA